jgi:hypothetical protein
MICYPYNIEIHYIKMLPIELSHLHAQRRRFAGGGSPCGASCSAARVPLGAVGAVESPTAREPPAALNPQPTALAVGLRLLRIVVAVGPQLLRIVVAVGLRFCSL